MNRGKTIVGKGEDILKAGINMGLKPVVGGVVAKFVVDEAVVFSNAR